MNLLRNSTIRTLCGNRVDLKKADEITVRQVGFNPPSNLLTNYNVYIEDLRTAEDDPERYSQEEIEKRKNQVIVQEAKILKEIHSDIKYRRTARKETIKTIQNLSAKYKPEPIYILLIIEYRVIRTYYEYYLIKMGNKDECEKFKEELENRKYQLIKREGALPVYTILACFFALIAALGVVGFPSLIKSLLITLLKVIRGLITNIAQYLN